MEQGVQSPQKYRNKNLEKKLQEDVVEESHDEKPSTSRTISSAPSIPKQIE